MNLRTLGIINGFLMLFFWSTIGFFVATNWLSVLPIVLIVLLPISIVVYFRTTILAKLIINGDASIKLYALDGFKWGIISGIVFWTCSITNEVLAAGSALMDENANQIIEYILKVSIPFTLLFGVVGAIHGIIFYYFNQWVIVKCS